ncbi:MAG: metallophosphoesterase [Sedimentisphaerales bacterium]|nr:metallophosphoesterase [Sedimentisphaerales bacterium]
MVKAIKSRQRYFKGVAFGTFGFCTSWAISSTGRRNEWVEVIHKNLSLANLPESFRGLRIIQASDFHCSRTVSSKYLKRCVERMNSLDADVILLTGDYITHDRYGRFYRKIPGILSKLKSRYGIYASLGNHDYGVGGAFRVDKGGRLDEMIDRMQQGGVQILRNSSGLLTKNGHNLWFVGLGDLWAKDFQPQDAFSNVNSDGAVIALSHNPDTFSRLAGYHFDAMVSGHTHGCRFEWTASSDKPLVNRRMYSSGMYHLDGKKLYVNRGLGRHGRIFNKRPEITVFTLS